VGKEAQFREGDSRMGGDSLQHTVGVEDGSGVMRSNS